VSLIEVEFSEGLQYIGDRSFEGCESSVSIPVPSTVRKMGTGVFSGCFALTHARVPSNVTRIENGTFGNTGLISLELPEGLEMIDLGGGVDLDDQEPEPQNIYTCRSLVNLVVPSEQHVDQIEDDAEFMEGLKFRHVASNFDDLVGKLQHRFDALPLHSLCYYQSYYSLKEVMENLRQSVDADPAAGNKVDAFGMTPFHILALSQTPNLSLFQALLKVYKVDIICRRDKFGSTPIDYLCLNHTFDSAMVIHSLVQTLVIDNRLQWLGLFKWKGAMVQSMSLLELALWKVKIVEYMAAANDTDHERDKERSPKRPRLDKLHLDRVDRQSCRINSGAHVVISNVLPFLGKVCSTL
jgi:hypothetical protein